MYYGVGAMPLEHFHQALGIEDVSRFEQSPLHETRMNAAKVIVNYGLMPGLYKSFTGVASHIARAARN